MAIFNIISFSYSSSYWKLIYYLVWTLSLDANTFEETRISPRARFYSMWWWFDAKFGVIKVLASILFIARNVGKYLYIAYNFSLYRLVLSIFTLMFILVLFVVFHEKHNRALFVINLYLIFDVMITGLEGIEYAMFIWTTKFRRKRLISKGKI